MRKIHYGWWIFISTCVISLVGFGMVVDTVGLFLTLLVQHFTSIVPEYP